MYNNEFFNVNYPISLQLHHVHSGKVSLHDGLVKQFTKHIGFLVGIWHF